MLKKQQRGLQFDPFDRPGFVPVLLVRGVLEDVNGGSSSRVNPGVNPFEPCSSDTVASSKTSRKLDAELEV